jgi:hypothetical protein
MNVRGCFLVFLLFWAQIDDFLVSSPSFAAAPVADDDDYVLSPRLPGVECSSHQQPVTIGLKLQKRSIYPVRLGVSSGRTLPMPVNPSSLYALMSLQI